MFTKPLVDRGRLDIATGGGQLELSQQRRHRGRLDSPHRDHPQIIGELVHTASMATPHDLSRSNTAPGPTSLAVHLQRFEHQIGQLSIRFVFAENLLDPSELRLTVTLKLRAWCQHFV